MRPYPRYTLIDRDDGRVEARPIRVSRVFIRGRMCCAFIDRVRIESQKVEELHNSCQ